MAMKENSFNEGLSSPNITMGLSKLNPPCLSSVNKDVKDNEYTEGPLKLKVQSESWDRVIRTLM